MMMAASDGIWLNRPAREERMYGRVTCDGATIGVGLSLALGGKMLPQDVLMRFTITGALAMGACSLLSHNSRAMWW
jgi:hypothetical protein